MHASVLCWLNVWKPCVLKHAHFYRLLIERRCCQWLSIELCPMLMHQKQIQAGSHWQLDCSMFLLFKCSRTEVIISLIEKIMLAYISLILYWCFTGFEVLLLICLFWIRGGSWWSISSPITHIVVYVSFCFLLVVTFWLAFVFSFSFYCITTKSYSMQQCNFIT